MNCSKISTYSVRSNMNTGELIRKYRKIAGLTQKELGEDCGMSEPAIRNYELGNRTPSDEQINRIAKSLGIAPQALMPHEMESARDALGALFELGDQFGLTPQKDGSLRIDPKAKSSKKLEVALKAWRSVLDEVASGEMTEGDYDLWKAKFQI